ncbi:MAG: protein-L-isoaspartate(D-aspartate) O-methyltransferase [Nitrosopumilaceae archaeon]|nr:protein-L-isoaspartate(D-aspartate) O-methyltransferase [Nitrosopumilaceae archaeon]NIU00359.1 protein-L-isoaspartate(D-aspartate) O-methyltransferase [Nitrosopumilaceae archaeon]NIU86761.1 protein-L-isoaspartate(D-aspartate) O-methyltransferase [Nitrosopumilaceae archaeon]NIV65461.1 protein-L-isoaspartate(D-aspartate) O-methyltransferase [Nitrosopumilaceae archaeon]NIX60961.1 protein-L-isoaspartate(D-aspartate) O-methyltransferase [Nitrosopumilaceae archaeon]
MIDLKDSNNFLIETIKRKNFLTDPGVDRAFRQIPRELFVTESSKNEAYQDRPLPTKEGQTISQPSVVARMTELLQVKGDQKILEIGSGSGWQSAILAYLVGDNGRIYTMDYSEHLVTMAKENHKRASITNAEVICGNGTKGLPEKAPFDRIIVTAACETIGNHIFEQLSLDGFLLAPMGGSIQSLKLYRKTSNGVVLEESEYGYVFTPLVD